MPPTAQRHFLWHSLCVLLIASLACSLSGNAPLNQADLANTQAALAATQAALAHGSDPTPNPSGFSTPEATDEPLEPTPDDAPQPEASAGFDGLLNAMRDFNDNAQPIKRIALTPDGEGWLLLYDDFGYVSENLPSALANYLRDIKAARDYEIKFVSFAGDGRWLLVYGLNGYYSSGGLATTTIEKLRELNGVGATFKHFVFTPGNGWIIIYGKSSAWWAGLDNEAADQLQYFYDNNETIDDIAFTAEGGWVMIYSGGGYHYNNIPDDAAQELQRLNNNGETIRQVVFTPSNRWIILYGANGYTFSETP